MRFDTEKLQELQYLGQRFTAVCHPVVPHLETAFVLPGNSDAPKIADCVLSWTGFNLLATHEEVLKQTEENGLSPQMLRSTGYINVNKTLLTGANHDSMKKLSLKDKTNMSQWLVDVFEKHLRCETHLAVMFEDYALDWSVDGAAWGFDLYGVCTPDAWKLTYNLHSLELAAAHKLHEQWSHLFMDGIPADRTLN